MLTDGTSVLFSKYKGNVIINKLCSVIVEGFIENRSMSLSKSSFFGKTGFVAELVSFILGGSDFDVDSLIEMKST